MIDIDITMPIHILNMLILIVIMNAVLYKPVRGIIRERLKKLGGLSSDIETFNKNAEQRMAEFERKIAETHAKAKMELEAMRATTQASGAEKIAQIRREAETAKSSQLAEVARQFAAVRETLKGELDGFAQAMAGKVLGRSL